MGEIGGDSEPPKHGPLPRWSPGKALVQRLIDKLKKDVGTASPQKEKLPENKSLDNLMPHETIGLFTGFSPEQQAAVIELQQQIERKLRTIQKPKQLENPSLYDTKGRPPGDTVCLKYDQGSQSIFFVVSRDISRRQYPFSLKPVSILMLQGSTARVAHLGPSSFPYPTVKNLKEQGYFPNITPETYAQIGTMIQEAIPLSNEKLADQWEQTFSGASTLKGLIEKTTGHDPDAYRSLINLPNPNIYPQPL